MRYPTSGEWKRTCCFSDAEASMQKRILLGLFFLFGLWADPQRAKGQTVYTSSATGSSGVAPHPTGVDDSPSWLFPVAKLDEALPRWIRIGGEYRNRIEGPIGIGYHDTRDFYLLDRLRIEATIQAKEWLLFHAEVQDARIFFNQHIPNANPNEDTWTLWEGYAQVGNSTEGWVDGVGGRQALKFGDERVIGPCNWSNVGRTFNVARVDLHHPGYIVSVFASSVVPGDRAYLHNVLPGNNLYGVYGSFDNIVPKATFEPYVLWRVAPSNSALPETLGRGHLNEVTIGLHWKGALPANFDYDTEFDGQTGSLGARSISAWAGYASAGKAFPKIPTAPRVFVEGNYASGTKNPKSHTWNTFDQLYPSSHDKFGFADVIGRLNLERFRVGVEEEPTKKWKLKQAFEGYWLATSHDNFYASKWAIPVPAHPAPGRHIANQPAPPAETPWLSGLSFGFR